MVAAARRTRYNGGAMETNVTMRPVDDPVLVSYRAALKTMYGDRIERIVLFGSRARGDAHQSPTMTWPCF